MKVISNLRAERNGKRLAFRAAERDANRATFRALGNSRDDLRFGGHHHICFSLPEMDHRPRVIAAAETCSGDGYFAAGKCRSGFHVVDARRAWHVKSSTST